MPASPDLTAARDRVHQGVGRNVLQFQRLELLLKHLLGRHQGSFTPETLEDEMKRRVQAHARKTFGLLAGDLFEKVILKPTGDDFVPADGAGSNKVSFRFGITITEDHHHEWQSRLKALVDERNHLVHLSLLTWDLNTIEGCEAAVAELDEQRGRIVAEFEQARRCYESLIQCMTEFHDELTKADIQEQGAPP